ncbi:MAG: hypothetical protein ACXWHZ_13645 [Usitatibacter sp.]
MTKALYRFLPALIASSAFAQSTAADAPSESASPVTVVIFLVLFFGSIAGYFAYVWWSQRKVRQHAEGKKPH